MSIFQFVFENGQTREAMDLSPHGHDPVMVDQVLKYLVPKPGEVILDCTAGRGGHSLEIAKRIVPGGTLLALDVDPENLKYAKKRLDAESLENVKIRLFHANFAEASDVLSEAGIERVDGLMADLGVSTNQLLEDTHGLSFNMDVKLDMRLDPRIRKRASDLLAELDEKQIADILHDYAQERYAWRIARKIVQTRATVPIVTTGQLARLVRSVVPTKWGQIDPATRTFQALRMAVNEEMNVLHDLLESVPELLKPPAFTVELMVVLCDVGDVVVPVPTESVLVQA